MQLTLLLIKDGKYEIWDNFHENNSQSNILKVKKYNQWHDWVTIMIFSLLTSFNSEN